MPDVYGWTVETIVTRLRGNYRGIGTATSGITSGMIQDFMDAAANIINGRLESRGIDPATILADDANTKSAHGLIREAVLYYVRKEAYELQPGMDANRQEAAKEWNNALKLIGKESQYLGKLDDTASSQIQTTVNMTNVDTTNPSAYQGRWEGDYNNEW